MPVRNVTIFRDPTPDGFINQRYIFTMAKIAKESTDFSLEEFDKFMGELALIAWKMAATWKHLNSYIIAEEALIEAEKPKPPIESLEYQKLEYSLDLYFELDGFLVQMKSTLDYLAKLPRSIVGNSWPPIHFGDKGKRVLDALKNNFPAKYANTVPLIEMCITEHKAWLQMAIEARDMINHYIQGGLDIKSTIVAKTTINGEEGIIVPMWADDLTLRAYLEIVWNNLVLLVEQFTIGFLSARFKPGLGFISNPEPRGSIISPIQVMPDKAVEVTFKVLEFIRSRPQNQQSDESGSGTAA